MAEKAFIYTRVSTDDKGQNAENQLEPCQKFCQTRGYDDFKVFTEEGSAWQRHTRPVFDSMLEEAFKEGIKHIVVWKYDRVSRRRVDFLSIWTKCNLQGIKIHSIGESFIETLNNLPKPWDEILGKFMLEIVAWLSEEESQKKSDNVKLAYIKLKKEKGNRLRWGRPAISQYQIDKIQDLRKGGYSIRQIADEMTIKKSTVSKYLSTKHKEDKTPQNPTNPPPT